MREATSPRPAVELRKLFLLLRSRYGEPEWWPAQTPYEVCVGAILTQNTSWKNVERAISEMKRMGLMTPQSVADMNPSDLESVIRSSGSFRQKARRLISFSSHMIEKHGGDFRKLVQEGVGKAREELLGLHGIGPETADSILLYACNMPVFVADAYSRRILGRIGMTPVDAPYSEVKRLVEERLPGETHLYNVFHALLVEHGKSVCRAKPLCSACFISSICNFGRSALNVENRVAEDKNKKKSGCER